MQAVLGAKKIMGEWRGALIVDGEFQDAGSNSSLADLAAGFLLSVYAADYAEGQAVTVTVFCQNSEVPDAPPR